MGVSVSLCVCVCVDEQMCRLVWLVCVCVRIHIYVARFVWTFKGLNRCAALAASFVVVAIVVAAVVVVAVDFEGFIICFWTLARLAWLPDEN